MGKLTKEDILKKLEEMSVDGIVPADKIAGLIYDLGFPEEYFDTFHTLMVEQREINLKHRELVTSISELIKLQIAIGNELVELATSNPIKTERVNELKTTNKILEERIIPLKKELELLKEEIERRKKGL